MKRDKENEMLRSTGENEAKDGVSPDFSVVEIIYKIFENSGTLWGNAALFSCVLSVFGWFVFKNTNVSLLQENQLMINKVIYLDMYLLAGAVVVFIAAKELIGFDSYRNKSGIEDIGSALRMFLKENQSISHRWLAVVMWISGLLISIGFGAGIGFGLIFNLERVLSN